MANEIQVTAQTIISKAGFTRNRVATLANITLTGRLGAGGPQSIGFAAHEALVLGEVTTCGVAWFKNLEAAGGNFVQIGIEVGGTFYPFMKLYPLEERHVTLGTNAPYAKADTGAVALDYEIFQV